MPVTDSAAALRSGKGSRDENFPVASWLVHPRHRGIILAFYEFVRVADDIADHPTLSEQDKLSISIVSKTACLAWPQTSPMASR